MSAGETLRRWLDPPGNARLDLDPSIRAWLSQELPNLAREGLLSEAQVERLALRYSLQLRRAGDEAQHPSSPAPV
jgi:hypothetical protein